MFGRSTSKAPSLGDTVSGAADQVRGWAEHVWQDSAERAAPVVDAASKKISEAAHKVGDAASNFQHKMQDDYIPTAAGQLARSEERRVGKGGRERWRPRHEEGQ